MSDGFTGIGKRIAGYRTAPTKLIEKGFIFPRGVVDEKMKKLGIPVFYS